MKSTAQRKGAKARRTQRFVVVSRVGTAHLSRLACVGSVGNAHPTNLILSLRPSRLRAFAFKSFSKEAGHE
jgi:hypothetical protein